MSLVIDSSMTLAWYFEDERTTASIAVLNRVAEAGAVVLALWRLEVLNGLQVAVRRGRINIAYRDASLTSFRIASRSRDQSPSLVGDIAALRPFRTYALRRGLSRIGTAPPASARDARRRAGPGGAS